MDQNFKDIAAEHHEHEHPKKMFKFSCSDTLIIITIIITTTIITVNAVAFYGSFKQQDLDES